jgi:dTDP-4-dehydrorhamnose 3,5-epimerase
MKNEITRIPGGMSIDDRGQVAYVNGFDFGGVKRFYMVSNHASGFVRAWHAHKEEGKYFLVVSGAAIVGAVKVDDWESPSKDLAVQKFVLSSKQPGILYIPPGHANGFKTLTQDTQIMILSTSTLEETNNDDYRYPAYWWDIWAAEER